MVKKRGSFTIEATLLMPFIIGVLVFIIYMAFYTHDRAVLTKCAYVAALRGSQILTGDADTRFEAEEQAVSLLSGRLLGRWEIKPEIHVSLQKVEVAYVGYMQIPAAFFMFSEAVGCECGERKQDGLEVLY